MDTLAAICHAEPILHQTNHRIVDLGNDEEVQAAVSWWTELTAKGGEGMVIKPLDFITKRKKAWFSQPSNAEEKNISGSFMDLNIRLLNICHD